jgi:hypothetical protein
VSVGYAAAEAEKLGRAIQVFRAEQGRLPAALSELAWEDRRDRADARELSWDASSQSIRVAFRAPALGGGRLHLRLGDDGQWRCTTHNLDTRLVPPGCRNDG